MLICIQQVFEFIKQQFCFAWPIIYIYIYIYINKLINFIKSIYQNWAHLTGFLIIKVYFKMLKLDIIYLYIYIYILYVYNYIYIYIYIIVNIMCTVLKAKTKLN